MPISDSELIDALGGTSKVSTVAEVTAAAVSQWRKNGMPKAWRKLFEIQLRERNAALLADPQVPEVDAKSSPSSN